MCTSHQWEIRKTLKYACEKEVKSKLFIETVRDLHGKWELELGEGMPASATEELIALEQSEPVSTLTGSGTGLWHRFVAQVMDETATLTSWK